MDLSRWLARRKMAALTKAFYDSAIRDDDEPPEPRVVRLLPGSATVAALLVVLVALALIGVWRHARSTELARASQQATEQSAERQAEETPHEDNKDERFNPTAPVTAPSEQVVVYVSGAVATPGVLTLPASSRVTDAITAAGGALDGADLTTINLARPLVDGEHIHVAVAGESPPLAPGNEDNTHAACIHLDTATATELQTLPGIGPALAARIIDYRATHPHIPSVDSLDDIPGIGPSLIEKIRPGVCP